MIKNSRNNILMPVFFSISLAIGLGFVAGYQIFGQSRDYENYLFFFSWLNTESLDDIFSYRFEPFFSASAFVLSKINMNPEGIYTVFAAVCIFFKLVALNKYKNYWIVLFVFLFFYLLRFFTLFEMTVLRATVASSIAFFIFTRRISYNKKLSDFLLLVISVLCHYSAVIFIFIYYLAPKKRSVTLIVSMAFFIFVLVSKDLLLPVLQITIPVFATYEEFNNSTIVPIPMILDIAYLFVMIYFWNDGTPAMRIATFSVLIAMALHFSLLEYSLINSRFRDLLAIFYIIYAVETVNIKIKITAKIAAIIFIVLNAPLHLYLMYIHDPLLT